MTTKSSIRLAEAISPYLESACGRLVPFFHLSGLVVAGPQWMCVELSSFHDRQHNGELVMLCERVNRLFRVY
jgi:hypothetical protein